MRIDEFFSKKEKPSSNFKRVERRNAPQRANVAKMASEWWKIKNMGNNEDAADALYRKIVAVAGPERTKVILQQAKPKDIWSGR